MGRQFFNFSLQDDPRFVDVKDVANRTCFSWIAAWPDEARALSREPRWSQCMLLTFDICSIFQYRLPYLNMYAVLLRK